MPVCSKEVPGIVGKTMNRKGTGPMEHSVLAPSNLMREKDQQTGIGDTVHKSCVAGKQCRVAWDQGPPSGGRSSLSAEACVGVSKAKIRAQGEKKASFRLSPGAS